VGRGIEGVRPKSVILPSLLHWHAPALRYDLQQRVQVSTDDILWDRIGWNEAWDFISAIIRDPSSHTFSAMAGDKYVPSSEERAAWSIAELNLNTKRKKGSSPIRLPRPWAGTPPSYKTESSQTDPEREARRAKLAAMF
tara:strand:- start:10913 stop:11329 length:417 start_codon:yes stop_codon:yes gene_type:complete